MFAAVWLLCATYPQVFLSLRSVKLKPKLKLKPKAKLKLKLKQKQKPKVKGKVKLKMRRTVKLKPKLKLKLKQKLKPKPKRKQKPKPKPKLKLYKRTGPQSTTARQCLPSVPAVRCAIRSLARPAGASPALVSLTVRGQAWKLDEQCVAQGEKDQCRLCESACGRAMVWWRVRTWSCDTTKLWYAGLCDIRYLGTAINKTREMV